MARQHQETLDQAGDEHGHDHQRDCADHLADHVRHHEERQKGGDGGERRRHHRRQHTPGAAFGRPDRTGAGSALRHRVLADHDRVVHDDADRHDEREQAHHVDGLARQHHHAEGGQQRDRNAHRDPEGDPCAEKHEQHEDHQGEAAGTVAEQHVDAVADELRRIVVVLDHQCRRQRRPQLLDEFIENGRLLQRVGGGRTADLQLDSRVARPECDGIAFVEAIADGRDVAEMDLGPVRARDHLDLADCLGRSGEADAADLLVGAAGHDTGRKVDRAAADARGDIAQREVELAQAPLADLDPDFLAPASEQVDLVDARSQKTLPDVPGMGTERRFREGSRDHDVADALVDVDAGHDRLLGLLRQGLDPGHGVLDIRERRIEIGPRLELDDDRADAFHGLGHDALDPVEEADLRLDRRHDVGIDILGAGAGPGHAHRDPVDGEGRKELGVHARKTEHAEQHHQHHQQVGSRAMAREQRDQIATRDGHRTSTLTPGPISGKRVAAMRSPSAISPETTTSLPTRASSTTDRRSSRPWTTA